MRLVARIVEWIPFLLFFALLHAVCTLVFAFVVYLKFDGANGGAWDWVAKVLMAPLVYANERFGNPINGFWLLIPNGLIWGLAIVLLGEWCIGPREQTAGTRGFPIQSKTEEKRS